ncbi:hypothetical protein LX64_04217 [Chitinophaga skermanii]|uniref:Uncharacterized protein n=1 Tax=Chitinophaga skermanii TaxID=331697 RepID=A0A327Q7X8_9BACT|nr:hypothetical protein [Chitinophaga skermanii]RAJ00510.1 hypothetical protein LX64_04217 [Chitinophaga skermanii]
MAFLFNTLKGALKAKVYGILETDTCPVCNHDNLNNEYNIYVEDDVIRSVSIMKDIGDYFADEGNFKILEYIKYVFTAVLNEIVKVRSKINLENDANSRAKNKIGNMAYTEGKKNNFKVNS